MKRAFRTIDRLIVFSNFEKTLYSEHFAIPESQFEMIPWRIRDPRQREPLSDSQSAGAAQQDGAVCAVGSQGRDYATLLAAMRRLPHIPLILIASPTNLKGLSVPSNVEVRHNVVLAEAEEVIRRSRFVVVPLVNSQTACGHVTIVYAMFEERAVVVSESAGVADYVFAGQNGITVKPGDAAALARAIEDLWNRADEARRLGRSAREFALARCLESQTIEYVRELISQLRASGGVHNQARLAGA